MRLLTVSGRIRNSCLLADRGDIGIGAMYLTIFGKCIIYSMRRDDTKSSKVDFKNVNQVLYHFDGLQSSLAKISFTHLTFYIVG